ncbi:type II secretion system F family protein [Frateuria aurantia]
MNSLPFVMLFLAAAAAIGGLQLWWRSDHRDRSSAVIDQAMQRGQGDAAASSPSGRKSPSRQFIDLLDSFGERFGKGRLATHLVAAEDILLLNVIGHDSRSGRAIFLAVRLLVPAALAVVAAFMTHLHGGRRVALVFAALCAGVLLPKWILGSWARRRKQRASRELPLLVDLLRLLQGTGFSMDQSLQMVSERFRTVMPVLGSELHEANTFYTHGRSREQSLEHLRNAYDDEIRGLVQFILQVHKHGGAVQDPLREFGERLREQRLMDMKERAGRLSVKITLVMMVTLLPALMAVLIGPAIVSIGGTMAMLHSTH